MQTNNQPFAAVRVGTHYQVECLAHFHVDGTQCASHGQCGQEHSQQIKWTDEFDNIVVTAGLNELLTRLVVTIPSSIDWFVGLKGAGTPAPGDTMASHTNWSENVVYGDATRRPFVPGSVASGAVSNTASKAVFAINGTSTIHGAFLTSDSTKAATTGSLYGTGDFAASRAVESGDTLNVTVTLSATAL